MIDEVVVDVLSMSSFSLLVPLLLLLAVAVPAAAIVADIGKAALHDAVVDVVLCLLLRRRMLLSRASGGVGNGSAELADVTLQTILLLLLLLYLRLHVLLRLRQKDELTKPLHPYLLQFMEMMMSSTLLVLLLFVLRRMWWWR
jgi:hypothetical protein